MCEAFTLAASDFEHTLHMLTYVGCSLNILYIEMYIPSLYVPFKYYQWFVLQTTDNICLAVTIQCQNICFDIKTHKMSAIVKQLVNNGVVGEVIN